MANNLETLANESPAGLTQQGEAGGSFNLENLARSFLQSQANKPRDDFIVGRGRGGTPIFDFTKPSEGESIMKGLEGLAMSFLQQKQQKKKQDFVAKVKEIMSSSATTEDKMNGLMQLKAVDSELYEKIGIDDINKTYLETMKLRGKKPKKDYLFKLPPKEKGGFLGFGARNEATQKVMQNMKSKQDLEELIENREAYEAAGVDVQQILDYWTQK